MSDFLGPEAQIRHCFLLAGGLRPQTPLTLMHKSSKKNLKIDSGQGETMSNILEGILHETTRGYTSKLASERKVVIWTYLVFCHIFYSQQIDRHLKNTSSSPSSSPQTDKNKKGANIPQ